MCVFKIKLQIFSFYKSGHFLETFFPFSDADSDDALQDNKSIGLSVSLAKLFNEVVNVKSLLINDHNERSLLFKL